jgi:hypothetical protein
VEIDSFDDIPEFNVRAWVECMNICICSLKLWSRIRIGWICSFDY